MKIPAVVLLPLLVLLAAITETSLSREVQDARMLDWTAEEVVGGDDDYDDWGPRVDVTSDGVAWTVWAGYAPAHGYDIYSSRNAGSGWSERERVSDGGDNEDLLPSMTVRLGTEPWVTWLRNMGGGEYSLLASHWTGVNWSAPETIAESCGRYDSHDVCADPSGSLWVALSTVDAAVGSRMIHVYRRDGSGWSGPETLGLDTTPDYGPSVYTAEGEVCVVWTAALQPADLRSHILAASREGDEWSSPVVVDDGPGNIGSCSMASLPGDTARVVVWEGNGDVGANADVESARILNGQTAYIGTVNSPDGASRADYGPRTAMSSAGVPWVVWTDVLEGDILSADIFLSSWGGSEWLPESSLGDAGWGKQDRNPDVAVSSDGCVWVVWMSYADIPPYDIDIHSVHSEVLTPVDFCCLTAQAQSDAILISWYASEQAAVGPFRVWRAASAPGGAELPVRPPEGSVCLAAPLPTDGIGQLSDSAISSPQRYLYWLEWQRDPASAWLGPVEVSTLPRDVAQLARLVYQRPNPSSSGVELCFALSSTGAAELKLFTASGRHVRTLQPSRTDRPGFGQQEVWFHWDGRSGTNRCSSGIYFARLWLDGRCVPEAATGITLIE